MGLDVYILYIVGVIVLISVILWLVLVIYNRKTDSSIATRVTAFIFGKKNTEAEYRKQIRSSGDRTDSSMSSSFSHTD